MHTNFIFLLILLFFRGFSIENIENRIYPTTEYTRSIHLSDVHFILMEKSAQPGEGEGCAHPLSLNLWMARRKNRKTFVPVTLKNSPSDQNPAPDIGTVPTTSKYQSRTLLTRRSGRSSARCWCWGNGTHTCLFKKSLRSWYKEVQGFHIVLAVPSVAL